jgi:hypothetical protein
MKCLKKYSVGSVIIILLAVLSIFIFSKSIANNPYAIADKTTIINSFKLNERDHIVLSETQLLNIIKAIKFNKKLRDGDKINLVRELIYQQILSGNSPYTLDTDKLIFFSKLRFFSNIVNPEKSFLKIVQVMNTGHNANCADTSIILALAYEIMGYHAWIYSYGDLNSGPLTHTVTLVGLNKKLYVEDAYYNYTYINKNNNMITLLEVLRRNKRNEEVYFSQGQLKFQRHQIIANQQNADWRIHHIGAFSLFIKQNHLISMEKSILAKDYKKLRPLYLVNYPFWLVDMRTFKYFPFAKYKENDFFMQLVKVSNRDKTNA